MLSEKQPTAPCHESDICVTIHVMSITGVIEDSPWLLLVFTLPASKASERVQIWRKLQKIGSIPFRNAGYMLPNTAEHLERFEWLATAIRGFKGDASILQIQSVDDLPVGKIKEQFREARACDYAALLEEIGKLKPSGAGKTSQSGRWRKRFEEIALIDFFQSPLRASVEEAIAKVERRQAKTKEPPSTKASKAEYQNRTWLTRPRPGIDRVSSAWLISRFIDPKAKFVFGNKPAAHPKAVPFDMFEGTGFGHQGDRCTFETLCHSFSLTDKKVLLIGQAVHDADLEDDKYGRTEGHTINRILQGWATQEITDDELLRRGNDLIEGLYSAL
jgi:hypothetical protein